MNEGEVWFASFPLEEDQSKFKPRPVVILGIKGEEILSVKITKHDPRPKDPFDVTIIHWREAGLDRASTARVSKTMPLDKEHFAFKIGEMYPFDLKTIQEVHIAYIIQRQRPVRFGSP